MVETHTNEQKPVRIPALYFIKIQICNLNTDTCCVECLYPMQALDFRCPAKVLFGYLLCVLRKDSV